MPLTETSPANDPAFEDVIRAETVLPKRSEPETPSPGETTNAPVSRWVGFLTYESGAKAEGVDARAPDTFQLPNSRFITCRDARDDGSSFAACFECVRSRRLKQAAQQSVVTSSPPVPNMSRAEYVHKVEQIKEYIRAGDVYQVNLTMRWAVKTTATPRQIYDRLCEINPAPYGALLEYDDFAIISASPELFLDVHDGRVITRPIKGTRPRTGDPTKDATARRDLETSEKERAELNMIVDLMRNDLGRVCEYGSVRVTDPGSIEEHPTVFHRVATIEGRLAEGKTNLDLLRATFPAGSITGAPKIRAMQIIRELEPTPRGVYCGSIGWIGSDGSMCMNVAIRTMVQVGDTVYVHAGSGIVADSDPEQEYEETLLKAKAMFQALGVDGF